MKAARLAAIFAGALILLGQFLAGCSAAAPLSEADPQPIPNTAHTAGPALTATLQRSPVPQPTRRAPPATEIPSPTPIASLTPIPFLYVFPIQPPDAATFGEGTRGHGYPATDLFAQAGTRFVAVTDGVVEFVSASDEWDPNQSDPAKLGGLAVSIVGYDGVRYYGSHLSGIAPGITAGKRVRAGDLLGYVGASGDARDKDPHLHFGISHPTSPDDWKNRRGELDPYPYLLAWKEGQNLTPTLP